MPTWQAMLGREVFLDSANLADLRQLFSRGLHKSEVLVLLCTPSVLTRPWCLLELWEAHVHGIPILPLIIIPVAGQPGFDRVAAHAMVSSLETELDKHTPGAFAIVKSHLSTQGGTVADLKTMLLQLISESREQARCAQELRESIKSVRLSEACADASVGVGSSNGVGVSGAALSWDPCAFDGMMIAATQVLVEP